MPKTIDRKFLPGDRVEILKGATLKRDYMDLTVWESTLATVVETNKQSLWVTLDEEPEMPRGLEGLVASGHKERWYCSPHEVRAFAPEREATHDQVGYDS
jgi:hypothetical protein